MMTESMATTSGLGVSVAARLSAGASLNIFRDAWEYRITETGQERLSSRKGASPAFLGILEIVRGGPATFSEIAARMPNIDGDDLELWLSAMCSMDLLSPVEDAAGLNAAAPAHDMRAEEVELPPEPASAEAQAPSEPRLEPRPELQPEPEPIAKPAAQPEVSAEPGVPVLLVHGEAKVRAAWRRALEAATWRRARGTRCLDLLEGGDLETVETLMRERRPAWIVLGLNGEDFDGLHLLRALKRPRAPKVSRVCLVVPHDTELSGEAGETAARADVTAVSVADIVRAVCGTAAVDMPAAVAVPATQVPSAAKPATAPPGETPVRAGAGVRPPANAPVWMNLLYGDAYKYGTFECDSRSDLEAQFPRLLVRMIEGWSRPDFSREIDNLVLDDRGDRHGFPPEVMEELWFLQQLHPLCHRQGEDAAEAPVPTAHSRGRGRKPDGLARTARMKKLNTSHPAA